MLTARSVLLTVAAFYNVPSVISSSFSLSLCSLSSLHFWLLVSSLLLFVSALLCLSDHTISNTLCNAVCSTHAGYVSFASISLQSNVFQSSSSVAFSTTSVSLLLLTLFLFPYLSFLFSAILSKQFFGCLSWPVSSRQNGMSTRGRRLLLCFKYVSYAMHVYDCICYPYALYSHTPIDVGIYTFSHYIRDG